MNKLKLSFSILFVLIFSFVCTSTKEAQMAIVVAGLQPKTQGALTVFDGKATFLSATGATSATGPLPLLGYVNSAEAGSLTISNVSGSSDPSVALGFGVIDRPNPEDFWTTLLPGIDLAVGGFEDLNIVLDTPTCSFGFDFAEHLTIPSEEGSLCGGGAGCVDSVFTVSLFLDGTLVDSFWFNAPNDVASFVGVWSAAAFNRVEIRESRAQGGVENDYYGQFYVGDSCMPEPECVSPPPGIVSWWSGDGNANDILGTHHGTPQNGATFAPGIVGQAFSLDGVDDHVQFGEVLSGLSGGFTLDAWIQTTATVGNKAIIAKYWTTGSSWIIRTNESDPRKVDFTVCNPSCESFSADAVQLVSTSNINDGAWHFIAATFDGTTQRLYIDGTLEASGTITNPAWTDNHHFCIGGFCDASGNSFLTFSGLIDEPEIFNRALSAAEIQAIFNAGSAGKCKNRAPVAICQNMTVTSGPDGTAGASIDNGSFDPDSDDAITLTESPTGPYLIGQTTVTLTVQDIHGASSSCEAVVTALYNFSGFFPPVDTPPTLNLVNAGSAIPVKFSLNGDNGLNIFAAGYPVSQQITCSDGAPVSDIEETVTAGNSSISYDAATEQYTYVWKTDKSWKGTCRQLILKLNDNSFHVANFQFG